MTCEKKAGNKNNYNTGINQLHITKPLSAVYTIGFRKKLLLTQSIQKTNQKSLIITD